MESFCRQNLSYVQVCDKKISAVEFTAKANKVLRAIDASAGTPSTPVLQFCAGTKKDVSQ